MSQKERDTVKGAMSQAIELGDECISKLEDDHLSKFI